MSRTLLWVAGAVLALALVPSVYAASIAYGVESLVWDAAHATYVYEERPAGLVVIVVGLVVCGMLVATAIAAVRAAILTARRRTHRASAPRAIG